MYPSDNFSILKHVTYIIYCNWIIWEKIQAIMSNKQTLFYLNCIHRKDEN